MNSGTVQSTCTIVFTLYFVYLPSSMSWRNNENGKPFSHLIVFAQYYDISNYLDLASEHIADEGLDGLGAEVVVVGLVLGHVLAERDVTVGRALLSLHAEELEDTCVVLLIDVDVDEQSLALELRGGSLVVGEHAVEVLGLLGQEEEQVVLDLSTEDLLGRLLGELDNDGQLVAADELLDVTGLCLSGHGQIVTALVKL